MTGWFIKMRTAILILMLVLCGQRTSIFAAKNLTSQVFEMVSSLNYISMASFWANIFGIYIAKKHHDKIGYLIEDIERLGNADPIIGLSIPLPLQKLRKEIGDAKKGTTFLLKAISASGIGLAVISLIGTVNVSGYLKKSKSASIPSLFVTNLHPFTHVFLPTVISQLPNQLINLNGRQIFRLIDDWIVTWKDESEIELPNDLEKGLEECEALLVKKRRKISKYLMALAEKHSLGYLLGYAPTNSEPIKSRVANLKELLKPDEISTERLQCLWRIIMQTSKADADNYKHLSGWGYATLTAMMTLEPLENRANDIRQAIVEKQVQKARELADRSYNQEDETQYLSVSDATPGKSSGASPIRGRTESKKRRKSIKKSSNGMNVSYTMDSNSKANSTSDTLHSDVQAIVSSQSKSAALG